MKYHDGHKFQEDDGSRNAIDVFMQDKEHNQQAMVKFCAENGQFWKGRVFLELFWEYEAKLRTTAPKAEGQGEKDQT